MKKAGIIYLICSIPCLVYADNVTKPPMKNNHPIEEHRYQESIFKAGKKITLNDAILKSIDSSPLLQSAQHKLNAREGSIKQAGTLPNPELEFSADNFWGNGPYRGVRSAEYTYGVSQKIELGKKRLYRVNAAKSAKETAHKELLSEKLMLEKNVHIAYTNVLAEAEAFRLSIEQENIAKNILAIVSKRVENAIAPEIQKSKAEIALSMAVITKGNQEINLKAAKKQLAGLWSGDSLEFSLDHAQFFKLKKPRSFEYYKGKMSSSPQAERFSHMINKYKALLDLERANNIPDPNINVGVKRFRETRNNAFVFNVSIALPLFDQNNGNITRAANELEEIKSKRNHTNLYLTQQLFESWQLWNMAYTRATELSNIIIPAAETAFKLAIAGYEKGSFSYLEVLDSQRTLFDAKAQKYQALKHYHVYHAEVRSMAGLSDIEIN